MNYYIVIYTFVRVCVCIYKCTQLLLLSARLLLSTMKPQQQNHCEVDASYLVLRHRQLLVIGGLGQPLPLALDATLGSLSPVAFTK